MPLIDLPLEKLKVYEGRNPKPADFDAYWNKALAELHAVDPEFRMVPAEFKSPVADCFELYFMGTNGAKIHGRLARPKKLDAPTPLKITFHGLGGNAGDWMGYLADAASGFTVVGLDCRGQHGTSQETGLRTGSSFGNSYFTRGYLDGPENLYYRHVYLDCARLAELSMELEWVDKSRVGVTGGSQGGGLTLVCAGLVKGLKRVAPVYPFLCDYRRIWEMDLALNAYHDIRDFFRVYDPRHEREEQLFRDLGYIDAQFFAERITAEVKMFTGLMDTICPPSSQFAAYNKIKSPKDIVLYPDYGHEALPNSGEMIYQYLLEM
ncbi:MAG: Cephalosporin-C deacetylase [Lentisphaerae bacterium ADurb.Bin242]|nr:MAG: Cephalosporin-C deacetylase [Lentisphaerae bacterium ADurb.Bin242]